MHLKTKSFPANHVLLPREKMLFEMLLEELRQNIANLQMMSSAIAQIDVLANFAHQARLNNWTPT